MQSPDEEGSSAAVQAKDPDFPSPLTGVGAETALKMDSLQQRQPSTHRTGLHLLARQPHQCQ